MDAQRDLFPFWQYQSLGDGRVRATHAALDQVVLPASSSFWQTHFPPWEWGCRCQVIPLSEEDVAELKRGDANLPLEQRRVLDAAALKKLEGERILIRPADVLNKKGAPTPINVSSAAEKGREGAFTWHPGDPRLTTAQLEQRYAHAPRTFAAFKAWAEKTAIPDQGRTVWEWMEGKAIVAPTALTPLPPPEAAPTFAELLAALGLDHKVQWTEADVGAILAGLKKSNPVTAGSKIAEITGPALHKAGFFSPSGLKAAMQDVLDILPPPIAQALPKIRIVVEQAMGGALGDYDPATKTLRPSFDALSKSAKINPHAPKETFWHELMHWIHLHGPQSYREIIRDHFAVRTAGEPVINLGYGSALGKRDKWWDSYAGRIYGGWDQGEGVEVPTRYFQLVANPSKFVAMLNPQNNAHAAHFLETFKIVMTIFQ
jgi:hypothetical protein